MKREGEESDDTGTRLPRPDWALEERLEPERLEAVVQLLYDRLFDDILVGFLFAGRDKAALVEAQVEYVRARLGRDRHQHRYTGRPIRAAHLALPITSGMFDRRQQILRECLEACDVDPEVRRSWLALDEALRPLVLRTGEEARREILGGRDPGDP